MNINKIALGTVQFGLPYGINNSRGQVPEKEVFEILNIAVENGIDTLDTAAAYGESEDRIGKFVISTGRNFKIVTKWIKGIDLKQSLNRLHASKLHACLIHHFDDYKSDPKVFEGLLELRSKGVLAKAGFSLYNPDELEYLLKNNISFDIVQVPFSVLDQRFLKYFDKLKRSGIEIHVRSVFLQGLVFKNPNELSGKFISIKDNLVMLNRVSSESGVPLHSLCLGYALMQNGIDKVVIGVDSKEQFLQSLDVVKYSKAIGTESKHLKEIASNNPLMLNPSLWGKK